MDWKIVISCTVHQPVLPQRGVTLGQFSSNMSDSYKDKEVRGEMGKEMTLSDDTSYITVQLEP